MGKGEVATVRHSPLLKMMNMSVCSNVLPKVHPEVCNPRNKKQQPKCLVLNAKCVEAFEALSSTCEQVRYWSVRILSAPLYLRWMHQILEGRGAATEIEHPVAYFSKRERRYSTTEKECLAIKLAMHALWVEIEHPVAYFSKRERRYSTTEKECLAIKLAMHAFQVYPPRISFAVQIENHTLNRLMEDNAILRRWSLCLQLYQFKVKWKLNCNVGGRRLGVLGLGTLQKNNVINYCMNNDKAALGGTLQEVQKSDLFSCTPPQITT